MEPERGEDQSHDENATGENPSKNDDHGGSDLLFKVDDVPPWHLCLVLGLQQYLTMLSSTISIPFVLAPYLCVGEQSPVRAHLVSSILFTSGIITLIQTTFGVRLPIVQGGSFAFLVPIFNMLSLPETKCPVEDPAFIANQTEPELESYYDELWKSRMRLVQGCVVLASLVEVVLASIGVIGTLLRFITPLTITPTITLIGLSLLNETVELASRNWGISLGTAGLILLFSQYMRTVLVPIPTYSRETGCQIIRRPLFELLPVLLAVIFMWILCIILTSANLISRHSTFGANENSSIIDNSPWFRVPYPGQWGEPTANLAGVIGILAGVTASVIESVGNYYACARLSGAPMPPKHAINRGILVDGVGCVLSGLIGTGVGSTSYGENVGAIAITKVGSRRVIQYAGLIMLILGVFTKFGAIFVTIPPPIVGGVFMVIFGMMAAVGLSNLQFVDLNSPRNLIICGLSLFCGLAIPRWLSQHRNAIETGVRTIDEVLFVLLSSSMLVGGLLGCILDNTIPGTKKERGLLMWDQVGLTKEAESSSSATSNCYDIPFITKFMEKRAFFQYIPFCPTYKEGICFKRCPKCRRTSEMDLPSSDSKRHSDENGLGRDNYGLEVSSV